MTCPVGKEELEKLKSFIAFCTLKPEILNIPELDFFKFFIEKLGGRVPPGPSSKPSSTEVPKTENETKAEPTSDMEESEEESDIDLDMTGVIEGDKDDAQAMGDSNKIPTEEEIEESSEYRSKAAVAYSEQKYEETIELYTKAIELNPGNALFHAKRGQAYLKLQKPNACIRDCDRALEINCDSASAYKFRGRAHRLLGNWELAAKDLRQACKLDFDEEADEWLREVTPNAKKIETHNIKQERKKAERELRKRQERLRKAQEANKKAQEGQQSSNAHAGPGGAASAGAGFGDNMNFEDLMKMFADPEIEAAMQDILTNPENIVKYQSNPKIMNVLMKVAGARGAAAAAAAGAGGNTGAGAGAGFSFPGGFPDPNGFPGAGGFPGFPRPDADAKKNTSNPNPPRTDFGDDGLD